MEQDWTASGETGTDEIHACLYDAPDDKVDRCPCSVFDRIDDEEVDDADNREDKTTIRG